MKYLLLITLIIPSLCAFTENLESFEAEFEQHIIDENDERVVYKGKVTAQKPDRAYWSYTEPVEKEIFIVRQEVVIIEPDMEQAIVRTLQEDIDFFTILSHAKKIDENRYEANYGSQLFEISLNAGIIESISYRDHFDNRIELRFSSQRQNHPVPRETFLPNIPATFDIVR
ncbi:MAG: LolA-like outer membrane lipoprotein chaperone [Sulfurimonadaceae bacterium]|nr:LolA-like outer membrane lipoprotein chaperone [Sulfurimonadaceae bacterium]